MNVEADFALEGKELVPSLRERFSQLELNDVQSSGPKFWTHVVSQDKFPHSRGLALFLLTMFGLRHTCILILTMNAIKTHNGIFLTNQHLQPTSTHAFLS